MARSRGRILEQAYDLFGIHDARIRAHNRRLVGKENAPEGPSPGTPVEGPATSSATEEGPRRKEKSWPDSQRPGLRLGAGGPVRWEAWALNLAGRAVLVATVRADVRSTLDEVRALVRQELTARHAFRFRKWWAATGSNVHPAEDAAEVFVAGVRLGRIRGPTGGARADRVEGRPARGARMSVQLSEGASSVFAAALGASGQRKGEGLSALVKAGAEGVLAAD